jgi:hypothetical protein
MAPMACPLAEEELPAPAGRTGPRDAPSAGSPAGTGAPVLSTGRVATSFLEDSTRRGN